MSNPRFSTLPSYSVDYLKELVGSYEPNSTTITPEDALSPISYLVNTEDYDDRYNFEMWSVGYSYVDYNVDPSTGLKVARLRREIPLHHPRYPNLYARKATTQGIQFAGKEYRNADPEWKIQSETARYKKAIANVEFAPVTFDVYSDSEIFNLDTGVYEEWTRYCRRVRTPTSDALTLEEGLMRWAEGDNVGQEVRTVIPFPERKADIGLEWLQVPEEWTHDSSGAPVKIESRLGCVNDSVFMGYPAGTLLFDSYSMVRFPIPLQTTDWQGYNANHITFIFKYFNPSNGVALSTYKGHNLLVVRSVDANNNTFLKYYLATSNGNPTTGRKLFQETDFKQLFSYWNA